MRLAGDGFGADAGHGSALGVRPRRDRRGAEGARRPQQGAATDAMKTRNVTLLQLHQP